jgi:hypothetical protein
MQLRGTLLNALVDSGLSALSIAVFAAEMPIFANLFRIRTPSRGLFWSAPWQLVGDTPHSAMPSAGAIRIRSRPGTFQLVGQ